MIVITNSVSQCVLLEIFYSDDDDITEFLKITDKFKRFFSASLTSISALLSTSIAFSFIKNKFTVYMCFLLLVLLLSMLFL